MKFTHYSCPLKNELNINGKVIHEREWIEVSTGSRKVDLCPLPGLHTESLEESFTAFKAKDKSLPSSSFALEYLESDLVVDKTAKINKLVFLDLKEDPNKVFKSFSNNDVIKVKIGRNSIDEEVDWFRAINWTPIKLRLDGNLSLEIEDLKKYLKVIPKERIDYFEEPLKNFDHYNELDLDEVSIALDENIARKSEIKKIKKLVIKPTFNLSFNETLKLISEKVYEVTISSSFDSPNNLEILHQLGHLTGNYCGLDTIKFFDISRIKSAPL